MRRRATDGDEKKVGELERTDPKSQTRFSTNLNSWHTKYSKKKKYNKNQQKRKKDNNKTKFSVLINETKRKWFYCPNIGRQFHIDRTSLYITSYYTHYISIL